MSQKRFLTPEEKVHWRKVALAKEQHDFPDHDIEVTVLDEPTMKETRSGPSRKRK